MPEQLQIFYKFPYFFNNLTEVMHPIHTQFSMDKSWNKGVFHRITWQIIFSDTALQQL